MIDVVMPQMGESIVEGTLTKWLKKAGEHVERDEPLFEISTDKVDTEIPSPSAGVLAEILVEEGKTVGINAVVGRIQDGANGAVPPPAQIAPAASAPPPPAQARPPAQAPAPAPAPAPEPTPVATVVEETAGPLSPLVRKMARENNIDLSKVRGTGLGSRITKHDLEAYLSAAQTSSSSTSRSSTSCSSASCGASSTSAGAFRRRDDPSASRSSGTAAAARTCPDGWSRSGATRRAHEQHAAEDRRAYGVQQAHLGARYHRA